MGRALSLSPASDPQPLGKPKVSSFFTRFPFLSLTFFKNDQSGSREDEYQKHLRNKPLTPLYLGNGRSPLSAPFSQLLRPPPPFTRTP